MLVRTKMTHDVITATPDTTLASALATTRTHRIRHLPIVQNDKLVGLISDRDLRLAMPPVWAPDHAELLQTLQVRTVAELMVTELISTSPDAPIEDAAQLLYTHRIGCLPVLESGKLVGILSETDLLRAYAELFGVQRGATRIEVLMPDRPGELARVVRLIGIEMRANIVGMVVPPLEHNQSVAIIHVQVENPTEIIEALRKIGYRVGSPALDASDYEAQAESTDVRRPRAMVNL